jgi:putative membrane protein
MLYLWLKTFHIVGVVSWFAGLFYHGRLLVYHAEALASHEPGREILVAQYRIMESRLLRIIMNPAMGFTLLTGGAMLLTGTGGSYLTQPWLLAKLLLVALLAALHLALRRIMLDLAAGRARWTGERLRVLNEAPTLLLVLITILAVFKSATSWRGLGLAVAVLAAALGLGIRSYAVHRRRHGAGSAPSLTTHG